MATRTIPWTKNRKGQANKIMDVVEDLRDYFPLTLRQVYYRLVAAEVIKNNRSRYNDLSKVIKQMRLDKMLSWDVIEDRTRRVSGKRGYTNAGEYLRGQVETMQYSGYSRCMVQGQKKYIELWVEKDALSRVFEDVAWEYCLRCVTCKGYQSISFLRSYAERAELAIMKGQEPVVLYFGDFDPSGVQMFEAAQNSLENDFDIHVARYERVSLNLNDIHKYNLPNNPDAVKKSDRRYQKFVDKYGEYAVDLDALHPKELKRIATDAVQSELDMVMAIEQVAKGKNDIEKIDMFNEKLKSYAEKLLVEMDV